MRYVTCPLSRGMRAYKALLKGLIRLSKSLRAEHGGNVEGVNRDPPSGVSGISIYFRVSGAPRL